MRDQVGLMPKAIVMSYLFTLFFTISGSIAAPMQLALAVVQDVGRQLPFTVLPAVQSGWVSLVREKDGTQQGGGAGGQALLPPSQSLARAHGSGPKINVEDSAPQGPLAEAIAKRREKKAASASSSPQDNSQASSEPEAPPSLSPRAQSTVPLPQRPVNRARLLKMSEAMSAGGRKRWDGMDEVERKTLIQVFDAEVASYQSVLAAVHALNKAVAAAAR